MWRLAAGVWIGAFGTIGGLAANQIGDLVDAANAAADSAKGDPSGVWAIWILCFVLGGIGVVLSVLGRWAFWIAKRALAAAETHSGRMVSTQLLAVQMIGTNREMLRAGLSRRFDGDGKELSDQMKMVGNLMERELVALEKIQERLPDPLSR